MLENRSDPGYVRAVIRSSLPAIFTLLTLVGTDEKNMKTKMWTVLLTTIRSLVPGYNCQDGQRPLETAVRLETPVRMEMSTQMIKTSKLP